jgi:Flp pilus assembly pilin Flp
MLYQLSYVRRREQRYHRSVRGLEARNRPEGGWQRAASLTTMRSASGERPAAPLRKLEEVTALTSHEPHRREDGQTMAEYAVALGVITPIIILTLTFLSETVATKIESIAGLIPGAG